MVVEGSPPEIPWPGLVESHGGKKYPTEERGLYTTCGGDQGRDTTLNVHAPGREEPQSLSPETNPYPRPVPDLLFPPVRVDTGLRLTLGSSGFPRVPATRDRKGGCPTSVRDRPCLKHEPQSLSGRPHLFSVQGLL